MNLKCAKFSRKIDTRRHFSVLNKNKLSDNRSIKITCVSNCRMFMQKRAQWGSVCELN